MTKKIGRNDTCPCGSGLKYKKCCIAKPNTSNERTHEKEKTNDTLRYIENHESKHILNTIIGLQLIPENHGKNVRIEELAKHTAINLNNFKSGQIDLLKKHLNKDYSYSAMEDIPENLFCESVMFFGGNYTVFPGIASYSIEIFRTLTESLFTSKNNLPEEFKDHVSQGITLLLSIGQIIINKTIIQGNIIGSETKSLFRFFSENKDFSINQIELAQIFLKHRINPKIINDFILSPDDEKFKIKDPDLDPLLYYPIIKFNDKFYFLLISNQVNALNEYILRLSEKYKCNEELVKIYHEKIWHKVEESCRSMHWRLTDIQIPKNKISNNLKEEIVQFDSNKLAYVCYFHNSKTTDKYNDIDEKELQSKIVNDRIKEVLSSLKSNPIFDNYKFLSLITYGSMGRNMIFGLEKSLDYNLQLSFSAYQLIQLASTEKWNSISLWKYAKSYEILSKSTVSFSETLDLYSVYKSKGESFYLSDDPKPNMLMVPPGDGSHLIKERKLKKDLHGALAYYDNRLVHITVSKSRDFAPFYEPIDNIGYYALCLEGFKFPIWIVNHQIDSKSKYDCVKNYAEAIGFWLHKLQSNILKELNDNLNQPIQIEIIIENEIFDNKTSIELLEVTSKDEYSSNSEQNKINFNISLSSLPSFMGSKNEGERKMMGAVLDSFNLIEGITFSNIEIENAIDLSIPLGNAKMILLTDSQHDLQIDNRWLTPPIYITDAEVNILLDELPTLIERETSIPDKIVLPEEKKQFFNIATNVMLEKLKEEISQFDFNFLLNRLMELHETLVWKREHNKTIIPAQILCFGGKEEKVNEILEKENKLVKTTLSLRCLIEYIASTPPNGNIKISNDDIDRLLTVMHEVVNYGFLSDAVHFKMDNPEVGKLKSGRIGISNDFYEDKLKPFAVANTKEAIDNYIDNFDNRFEIFESTNELNIEKKEDNELETVDKAFLSDWGISYLNIYKFCFSCAMICINKKSSVITINESDFIKEISTKSKLSDEEIAAGIERFSICRRDDYLTAPEGYKNDDVFPWKYNREFSIARRFIVKHTSTDGDILLTFGFRNAISTQKQLQYLFLEGKLNYGGEQIEKLLGKYRKRKGKQYRNKVKDWLKNHKELFVIDYEVDISPNGPLVSDKKYGDIDILVFDKKSNTILSLECKDTVKAKNIHEMKKEMDNYLGRDGGTGMIKKHIERDKWLNNNKKEICKFLKIETDLTVKSYMITSEVIPTIYIKAEALPIPIIAFPDLKRDGLKLLLI